MGITLYTTHCPKCKVVERKLQMANVEYSQSEDIQEMINLGFKSAPVLSVNGEFFLFKEACNWADERRRTLNAN